MGAGAVTAGGSSVAGISSRPCVARPTHQKKPISTSSTQTAMPIKGTRWRLASRGVWCRAVPSLASSGSSFRSNRPQGQSFRTGRGSAGAGAGRAGRGGTPADAECVVLLHGLGRSEASLLVMEEMLGAAGFRVVNLGYPSTEATIEELRRHVDGGGGRVRRGPGQLRHPFDGRGAGAGVAGGEPAGADGAGGDAGAAEPGVGGGRRLRRPGGLRDADRAGRGASSGPAGIARGARAGRLRARGDRRATGRSTRCSRR